MALTQQLSLLDVQLLAEGWDLEAKKAAGRDGRGELPGSFFESYVAMANTDGGIILLGVQEQPIGVYSVHGIVDVERVQRTLWDGLNDRDRVSHNLLSKGDIEVLEVAGQAILRVRVPRARRTDRPVYLGRNPLMGTYRRNFEGDYRCDEETVRRMLAEQVEDARDAQPLDGFDMSDLDDVTVRAYRNQFRAVRPDHPWIDLETPEFLRMVGAWTRDRSTGKEAPTLAGMLMFGRLRSILDAVPHYIVDYQERPAANVDDVRWVDRITTDGSWSGNLYDFYRRVIQRLGSDLKVPFRLDGTSRVDETPVHVALREALVNALIHADYSGRVSVLVVRRPDGFSFRNPGALRLPLIDVLDGGTSDCRNRNLQKMFQLAGLGEQAGSGVPRIYRNWKEQHWRAPELWDDLDPDRTQLEMRMVSLLPEQTLIELDERFGPAFRSLPEVQRLALATVAIEGRVTNARLQRMTSVHPRDLTQELAGLVRAGYLVSAGAARGTYYVFATDGVTEEKGLERSVVQGELRFPHNVGNSPHNEGSSTHNRVDSPHSLDASPPMLDDPNVTLVRRQRRVAPAVMERAIIATIMHRFVPLRELAVLLDRAPRTLQDHYLRPLVEAGRVELRHPDRPNHPDQAYRAARNATRD